MSRWIGALSVALLLTIVASVPGAELEIPRLDGSTIQAHVDLPVTSPHPFCVVIQGSTCTGAAGLRDSFRSAVTSLGAGLIVLEKYGLPSRDGNCPPEYLRNNTIHQRILDHLLLVSHLRRNRRGWDGRIVWAGGSEGGIVAALLSPLVPETRATVLLASGGGMTMAEELKLLERQELERQRSGKEKMEERARTLESTFSRIDGDPTPFKHWRGETNTHKWWASILHLEPLRALEQVETPIYLVHGRRDASTPIESADLIATRFKALGKTNLTYRIHGALDHRWTDPEGRSRAKEVLAPVLLWLKGVLGAPHRVGG